MGKKRTRKQKIRSHLKQPLTLPETPITIPTPENPLPVYIIKDLKKTSLISLIIFILLALSYFYSSFL